MKLTAKTALVLGAAMLLGACASITRGTRQDFYILSDPVGAKVQTTDGYECITPCKVKLKRKTEFNATIVKDGYKPGDARVDSSARAGGVAGAAGNIIAGGIIGIFVDGSNGAMNDLRPNPLNWVLAPVGSSELTRVAFAEKPTDLKKIKAAKFKRGLVQPAASAPAAAAPAAAAPAAAPVAAEPAPVAAPAPAPVPAAAPAQAPAN